MNEQFVVVIVAVGAMFVLVSGMLVVFAMFHRRVAASEALVVTTPRGAQVLRNGGVVLPIVQSAEVVDLTTKTISCTCKGRDALGLRDGTRVDVEATFAIRVGDTSEAILEAAKKIGAARLRDQKALEELFGGHFARALASVVREVRFEALERERSRIEDEVMKVVGEDLQGMVVDRIVITRVDQTSADGAGPFR